MPRDLTPGDRLTLVASKARAAEELLGDLANDADELAEALGSDNLAKLAADLHTARALNEEALELADGLAEAFASKPLATLTARLARARDLIVAQVAALEALTAQAAA